MRLFEYDLEVYHVSKKKFVVVDDFSRLIKYLFYDSRSKNFILIALIVETTTNFAIDNTFNNLFQFNSNEKIKQNSFTQSAQYEKL